MPFCAIILVAVAVSCSHHEGDYVPTARKAQFKAQRTNWHDLLGRHCPRFGHSRVVAVPLSKPAAIGTELKDYKLQLSFDGDRFLTPWMPIIGKRAPKIPFLDVELRRSGTELLGVRAKVSELPSGMEESYRQLITEFRNASYWPKHIIVHYHFKADNDVDLDRGLYVLLIVGLVAAGLLCLNALTGAQGKLGQFVHDMVIEDSAPSTSQVWKGDGKAE